MNRKSILLLVAFTIAFSMALTGISVASHGPEDIVLKTAAGKKPAVFPHKKHQEMDGVECATCHHSKDAEGKIVAYSGDSNDIQKCASCHNKDGMENPKLNTFKLAGHARCKECHKQAKADGNLIAPTKCTGCHITKK